MDEQLVAVLTPRKLHVIKIEFDGENPIRAYPLTSLDLDHAVVFAQIGFTSSAASRRRLRVCLSNSFGVFAYSVNMDSLATLSANIRDHLVWSYTTPEEFVEDRPFAPSFGHSIDSVSWIEGALVFADVMSPMRFVTLTSSLTAATTDQHHHVISGLETPALYALCVRDYDDGLGLLAFGNGFGEVALYNLCGADLRGIRSCRKLVMFPAWDGEECISTVSTFIFLC